MNFKYSLEYIFMLVESYRMFPIAYSTRHDLEAQKNANSLKKLIIIDTLENWMFFFFDHPFNRKLNAKMRGTMLIVHNTRLCQRHKVVIKVPRYVFSPFQVFDFSSCPRRIHVYDSMCNEFQEIFPVFTRHPSACWNIRCRFVSNRSSAQFDFFFFALPHFQITLRKQKNSSFRQ